MKKGKILIIIGLFVLCLFLVAFIFIFRSKDIVVGASYKKISISIKPNQEKVFNVIVDDNTNIIINDVNVSDVNSHYIYLLESENKIIRSGLLEDESIIYNVDKGKYEFKIISDGDSKKKVDFFIKKTNPINDEYSILDEGRVVNEKILKYAGFDKYSFNIDDPNSDDKIKSIKLAKKMNDKFKNKDHLVSSNESKGDIYAWLEGDTLYFYSNNKIAFNVDSSSIFSDMGVLVDINDLKYFDFSNVKYANNMFSEDNSLSDISAISYFDTQNVVEVSGMFSHCYSLIDISPFVRFASSKLESVDYLLDNTRVKDIMIMKYFDVSRIEDFSNMFSYSDISDLSALKDWNTQNAQDISNMFSGTKITKVDALRNWNVSKVKSMFELFFECGYLQNIDGLSEWKTDSLESINVAFAYTNINNLDALDSFNTDKLTSIASAFYEDRELKDISDIKNWNVSNIEDFSELFSMTSVEDISPVKNWDVSNAKTFKEMFSHTQIRSLDGLKDWNVSNASDFSNMFNNTQIRNLDGLKNWNVNSGTNFEAMFANNTKLEDTSGINDWQVKGNTQYLFEGTEANHPSWYVK